MNIFMNKYLNQWGYGDEESEKDGTRSLSEENPYGVVGLGSRGQLILYRRMIDQASGYKKITNVIFNPPATIVFWGDGTKTVVKCQEDDVFDPEKGLAMAIAKKFFDNKGSYCNQIKPWIEKYEEERVVDALEQLKKFEQALGGSLVKIGDEEELKNIENDEKVQTALKSLSSIKFKAPDLSPFRKALYELQDRKVAEGKTNLVHIKDEQGLINVATGEKFVLSSKRTPLEEAYWKLTTLGEQHSKEDLQAAIDETIGYLGQALAGRK